MASGKKSFVNVEKIENVQDIVATKNLHLKNGIYTVLIDSS
jgi:hypothetical protein